MIRAWTAAVALAAIVSPLGGTAHRKNEQGNRRYEEKAYDESLRAYTEAQAAAPDSPELHYNLGNVLYRQENWSGAGEEYGRALLSAAPSLAPSAAYNLGNARYREGRFEEAAQAYRQALGWRPDDMDAKRNLELALSALERKKNPPEKGSGGEGEEQRKEKEKRAQEQQQGGGKRREPAGAQAEDRGERERERRDGGAPRMSPEEAKRLLDSVSEQEKATLRKRAAERAQAEAAESERDW